MLRFLGQELVQYHYSSCCCWADPLQSKPKAPSFQIWLGWKLAGFFFK